MNTLVIEKTVYKSVVTVANELWEKEWKMFFPVTWNASWDNQSLAAPGDRTSSAIWDLQRRIYHQSHDLSLRPRRAAERTAYEVFRHEQINKLDRLEIWVNEFVKLGLVAAGL